MRVIQWVRTVLATAAFAWAMTAWHLHDAAEHAERARLTNLIEQFCAAHAAGAWNEFAGTMDEKERGKAVDESRVACLMAYGLQLSGGAARGTVIVEGTVGVEPR